MQLLDRRDYYHCRYCTTFHFPQAAATTGDGVEVLRGAADGDCPVCAKPLVAGRLDRQPVRTCPGCRGILMTNDVFSDVVRARRARGRDAVTPPAPIREEELHRALRCPACCKRMETHPYYGPGAVVIDTCSTCRLIWLDCGELKLIETAPGVR